MAPRGPRLTTTTSAPSVSISATAADAGSAMPVITQASRSLSTTASLLADEPFALKPTPSALRIVHGLVRGHDEITFEAAEAEHFMAG